MLRLSRYLGVALLASVTPAAAQQTVVGRVAESAVGQAGQRQTREESVIGIEPMMRIQNRIQNRIQSRLRTRIDRDSSSVASAASSVENAVARTRTAGRISR